MRYPVKFEFKPDPGGPVFDPEALVAKIPFSSEDRLRSIMDFLGIELTELPEQPGRQSILGEPVWIYIESGSVKLTLQSDRYHREGKASGLEGYVSREERAIAKKLEEYFAKKV